MKSFIKPSGAKASRSAVVPQRSRATTAFVDNRPQAIAQRKMQQVANVRQSQHQPVQRVKESEFRASPARFLETNVLSLTMRAGLSARANGDSVLHKAYDEFLAKLGSFSQHWFKLEPDVSRTQGSRAAYILTPAIEKYIQANPDDELLRSLRDLLGTKLPLEPDKNYLASAYVDYKNIGVGDLPQQNVGHTLITKSRDSQAAFNPDFVFTATMNGCAFVTTPGGTDEEFTAWHFQSTTANADSASAFRRAYNPGDWYGPEEYDSGPHAGLFEVTNFLHRGPDGGWYVISQQNETSSTDMSVLSINKVDKRRLNVDAPNTAAIIKRVYVSLQKEQNSTIRRYTFNAHRYLEYFTQEEKNRLSMLERMVTGFEREEAQLAAAHTMPELHAVSQKLRTSRDAQMASFTLIADKLNEYLEHKYADENSKKEGVFALFGKSKADKARAINLAINNIRDMKKSAAKTSWMSSLEEETR